MFVLAAQANQIASDPESFQEDAIAAAETANLSIVAGAALLTVGVIVGVGGVAMAVLWGD